MTDPNYIVAKTFLNLLTDDQKIKLFKEVMEGVGNRKKMRAERVERYKKYLDKK